MSEEVGHGTHVGWGILVEQRGGVGGKPIGSVSLTEETVNCEIVAQHAHSLLRSLAVLRDVGCSGSSSSHMSEEFKVDGALKGHSQLIRSQSLVDTSRVDLGGRLCGHG